MTITNTAEALRNLTSEQLDEMFAAETDTDTIIALVKEMDRRERAERKARRERERRERIRNDYAVAQHAAYLLADAECRGNLLSKAGIKAGIKDEHVLWTGRESVARKYASEELNEWWDANGRLTITEFTKQYAAAAREAREQARQMREEARRIKALEVAARKAARNAARAAREAAKAERAARRGPKLTVITNTEVTTAPAVTAMAA
jgi:hypothetical protein